MEFPHSRRRFSRSPSRLDVRVRCERGSTEGSLRDISIRGVFVICDVDWPAGTLVTTEVVLSGQAGVTVKLEGEVRRNENGGLAIEVSEVGLDSFQHLKQIVVLNSATPETVELEIAEQIVLGGGSSIARDSRCDPASEGES